MKAIQKLQEAKRNLQEAEVLISEIDVVEEVGESYRLTTEMELILLEVSNIKNSLDSIIGTSGAFKTLQNTITEKLIGFFRDNHKQKKYEGEKVEVGYRVVNRKSILDGADSRFFLIEKKPNNKAIDEYRKSTITDENPDGLLPFGVQLKTSEYVTFKALNNE